MRHWHEQNNILSPCKSTKNCRVTDFDEGKEIVWECGCKEKHGLDEYTHQFAIFDSKWCEEFGANTKEEIGILEETENLVMT